MKTAELFQESLRESLRLRYFLTYLHVRMLKFYHVSVIMRVTSTVSFVLLLDCLILSFQISGVILHTRNFQNMLMLFGMSNESSSDGSFFMIETNSSKMKCRSLHIQSWKLSLKNT